MSAASRLQRQVEGDARLAAVEPIAQGFIDAVHSLDRRWIADVCKRVEMGRVDVNALLVYLAAKVPRS